MLTMFLAQHENTLWSKHYAGQTLSAMFTLVPTSTCAPRVVPWSKPVSFSPKAWLPHRRCPVQRAMPHRQRTTHVATAAASAQPEQAQPGVTRVGFLGLGIMGTLMAGNLVKAGYEVVVWNRTPQRCVGLQEQGATVASTPKDVAASCDVVFGMLADPNAAMAVATSPEVTDLCVGLYTSHMMQHLMQRWSIMSMAFFLLVGHCSFGCRG